MKPHKTTIRSDTTERHVNKYRNKNLIHRYTLDRFFDQVVKEVKDINPQNVLEFGCGEGLFLDELKKRNVHFKKLTGIDLREDAISHAGYLFPEHTFHCIDLFDFQPEQHFDLVIASQVIEHLVDPDIFIKKLISLTNKYLLLTVPWEPWFQLMNFIRGRDFMRLGNHPEHINHWTAKKLNKFVSKHALVHNVSLVFPFIILTAKVN